MQQHSTLATIRKTPEVILWALAIFVCGVVVLPLVHLVGHGADHVHGLRDSAHARAHAQGLAHADEGLEHGAGDPAHFGLALIEAEPPELAPPSAPMRAERPLASPPPARIASRWTPIRPGAP